MSDKSEQREKTEDATSFFNRGRRCVTEIMKDNEQLRSKIRRLEQALRGASGAGRHRGPEGGGTDER